MSCYKNTSRLSKNVLDDTEALDARGEFDRTLEDSGYLHVIRKVDLTKRCSCIALRNDRFNEPDPTCKICDDIGYLYTDIKDLCFKSYTRGPEQAATPERMRADQQVFFLRWNIFETEQEAEYSRILVFKTDGNGNIDKNNTISSEYNITDAIQYSIRGYRIYWKVAVNRKEV